MRHKGLFSYVEYENPPGGLCLVQSRADQYKTREIYFRDKYLESADVPRQGLYISILFNLVIGIDSPSMLFYYSCAIFTVQLSSENFPGYGHCNCLFPY